MAFCLEAHTMCTGFLGGEALQGPADSSPAMALPLPSCDLSENLICSSAV